MANDINDNNESAKTSDDAPIADLHLSQIIAALHQNAIDKCKDQLGDKFRIVNSAIDESGDKVALTSQGEHIVSVVLTEKAADAKEKFSLESAVSILKTYVQWFVGPDLASKVNDSTVQALADQTKSNAESQENGNAMNESKKPFMTFSQFLREAEESIGPGFGDENDGKNDEKPASDENVEFGDKTKKTSNASLASDDVQFGKDNDGKDKDKNANAKDKNEKKDSDDQKDEDSQVGYYISYDLKVDGMQKKSKIEDSKKSIGKSLRNFLRNIFDDVTFTASGLFGGGDSFQVKDIKTAIRKAFGPIDPDELVRNVEDRLEKKFKGSSPHPEVKIQDRRTLIADLGSYVKGQQKKQIEKADYSFWIKLNIDDPKKQILNRGSIADIVQASITGLYKKFRYRISKNDVIYIPNYKDVHANTEKVRALYSIVPTPNRIQAIIQKSRNLNDAVIKIDKIFEKINRDKDKEDCDRADKCEQAWRKFFDNNNLRDRYKDLSKVMNGSKQYNEFFTEFLKRYTKIFKQTEDKSLNESRFNACFALTNSQISRMILESMFDSQNDFMHEAEDEQESDEKPSFKTKQAISLAYHFLDQKYGKDSNDNSWFAVECGPKDIIQKKLLFFEIPASFTDSKYKNAIAVIPAKNVNKQLSESSISNDIFSILFEDDAKKPRKSSKIKIKDADIELVLRKALKDAGAVNIGDFISLEMKTLNESRKKHKNVSSKTNNAAPKPSQSTQDDPKPVLNKAYAMTFGDEEVIPVDSGAEGSEALDNIDADNEIKRNDLYIIPIKGMKYEDPEFSNKNLV